MSKPEPPDFEFEWTNFGFRWGPMLVERDSSDPRLGVVLHVETIHKALEIRATPGGRKLDLCEVEPWGLEADDAD